MSEGDITKIRSQKAGLMKLKNEEQVRMALRQNIPASCLAEETDPDYVVRCIKKATNLNASATIFGRRYLILPIVEMIDNYYYKVVKLVIGDSHQYNGLNADSTIREIVVDF